MARTSKRHIEVKKQVEAKKIERVYIAGVYARLSRDHKYDANRDLSNSINGQIAIAEDYVEDNSDITITEIYTDYEYSGTNFERPAFKEMMGDIRLGKINCIIVKDLSRLGREYLEVGDYIETVFPFLGVRFISVNDKFDTAKEMSSGKPLEVILKNLINDMYAKDISNKIKSAKRIRMEQGLFVGSVPPYGYRVIKVEGGQKLELVSETAQIVKLMFKLTSEGLTVKQLTQELNRREFTPPMVHYKTGRLFRNEEDPKWTYGTVAKILRNEVYKGDMVQGIKSQNLAKGQKQKLVDENEYIVVLDTHEAIVDRDFFDSLQKERKQRKVNTGLMDVRTDFPIKKEKKYSNLLYCDHCGRPIPQFSYVMKRHGGIEDRYYKLECKKDNGDGIEPCRNQIYEDELDEVVLNSINHLLEYAKLNKEDIETANTQYFKTQFYYYEKELIKLNRDFNNMKDAFRLLYESFVKGKITKKEFLALKEDNKNIQKDISEKLHILDLKKIAINENYQTYLKEWQKLIDTRKIQNLTEDVLDNFIERITLRKDRQVKIDFLCKPDFEDSMRREVQR